MSFAKSVLSPTFSQVTALLSTGFPSTLHLKDSGKLKIYVKLFMSYNLISIGCPGLIGDVVRSVTDMMEAG